MKKKITMTLITVMVLSVLAACGNEKDAGTDYAGIAAASGEIRSGEIESREGRSDEDRSDEDRSGKDKSDETGVAKAESDETGKEIPEETVQEANAEDVRQEAVEETKEPVKETQKITADNATSSTLPPINPMFDAGYYTQVYPDLAEAFGNNEALLWKHYVEFGEREGRKCYDGDPGGSIVVNGQMAQSANASGAPASDATAPADDIAAPANDIAAPANDVATPAGNIEADRYAQIMLEQINAYRAENGVAPLEFRQDCLDVANLRVWELPTLISHTRPNGQRFYTAYEDCGYKILNCAENLSVHHSNWDFESEGDENVYVEYFMNNFKNSASHNATMLNAKWKYVGFAFVTNYDNNCYVVQQFTR